MKLTLKRQLLLSLLCLCALSVWADAEPFTGTGRLGSYTGSLSYKSTSSTSAILEFSVLNTSPIANGGYLTAIAFNNPSDKITGASLSSAPANFGLLGASSFDNSVPTLLFGDFDLGASTGGLFAGFGPPSNGIGAGDSGTFEFQLTGTMLDTLTEEDFFDEGSFVFDRFREPQFFAARFRGFNRDRLRLGDAVGATAGGPGISEAPEPTSLALAGIGALFLLGGYTRKRLKLN